MREFPLRLNLASTSLALTHSQCSDTLETALLVILCNNTIIKVFYLNVSKNTVVSNWFYSLENMVNLERKNTFQPNLKVVAAEVADEPFEFSGGKTFFFLSILSF